MSALTKILIVLLTISSIFLCGALVSHIAKQDNYKEKYETERTNKKSAVDNAQASQTTLNEEKNRMQAKEDELNAQIQQLNETITNLTNDLVDAKTEIESVKLDTSKSQSTATILATTNTGIQAQLDLTNDKLSKARAENIENTKELNQLTTRIEELTLLNKQLETDRRRLEEKIAMLDKSSLPPAVVTRERGPATSTRPVIAPAGINGRITKISRSLVTLSVGTSDGVKKGMTFYVSRGDDFICEVKVTDVDISVCAGSLALVQQQPKIGDTVSTKLY